MIRLVVLPPQGRDLSATESRVQREAGGETDGNHVLDDEGKPIPVDDEGNPIE